MESGDVSYEYAIRITREYLINDKLDTAEVTYRPCENAEEAEARAGLWRKLAKRNGGYTTSSDDADTVYIKVVEVVAVRRPAVAWEPLDK